MHLLKTVILLSLIFSGLLYANNEMQFTHLTTEDGLSLNIVTEILQDSRGFMWFGTYNGLNRYDGTTIKKYYPDDKNPSCISSSSIWSLYEDSKGMIWIGTLDGLNKYDWRNETFTQYRHSTQDTNSISNGFVFSISEDSRGNLWIGTLNGLNKYNPRSDNFTVYKKVSDLSNANNLNSVTCIEEDSKGSVWFGTWKGLTCLKPDGKFSYYQLPRENEVILYNDITAITEDNFNNLWIGTNGQGLYKFNKASGVFARYLCKNKDATSISDNSVLSVYRDTKNILWVGTKKGLNKFVPSSNNFVRILNNPEKPLSLSSDEVYSICEDKSGILWIGTSEGLNKYYNPENNFRFINQWGKTGEKLFNHHINSIYIDQDNNTWAATKSGIVKFDNHFKVHNLPEYRDKSLSLKEQFIWSVYKDSYGLVWIGTDLNGLYCYNPADESYKIFKYDEKNPNSLSNNGVITICEDRDGNIWAGTWWGLNVLNRRTGKFTRYSYTFRNASIWSVSRDSKDNIWIGTDGCGAYVYNPNSKKFENYFYDSLKQSKSNASRISYIFEDKDGEMWFATLDGLRTLDPKTGKMDYYDEKDNLPSNLVNSVIQDDNGIIWVSTDKGLAKFNKKRGTFTTFSKRNGLIDVEFSPRAAAKTIDGKLLFGGKKGIIIFDPESMKEIYFDAPVVFTDLLIFNQHEPVSNKSKLKSSITFTDEIVFSHDDDIITIEFALLDYFNTKTNRFRYKLAGFDTEWNDIGNRNFVTFTNLPPGEYKLIVNGYNSSTSNRNKEAKLRIIITPSFYETSWFRVTMILAFFVATIVFSQIRIRTVKKTNKLLGSKIAEHTKDLDKTIAELCQEIAERKKAEAKVQSSLEEKEVLLKEIHHRVKNNLQVISSLLYLQSVKAKDEETLSLFEDSQRRIKSMALIHERLYQSSDFAQVNFGDYVHELLEHLNRSFKKTGMAITTKIEIKNIQLSLDTAIPSALIVNELFTNAYKYAFPPDWANENTTSAGFIVEVILIKGETDEFTLSICDNGIGMPEEINVQTIHSLGLKLVNSMVKQLDGSIEIIRDKGTCYNIKFFEVK